MFLGTFGLLAACDRPVLRGEGTGRSDFAFALAAMAVAIGIVANITGDRLASTSSCSSRYPLFPAGDGHPVDTPEMIAPPAALLRAVEWCRAGARRALPRRRAPAQVALGADGP
ncbi:MAG: hypothetical protein M3019_00950 [Candidatus Dormibacteraeota bacterium]|nr:hypothetical protein [Candidatus Dormibacteraeota bacterium]